MDLSTTFASLRKTVAGLSLVTLVAGMLATGVATAATDNIFKDVTADAWFAQYVNPLATEGVIDSTKDMYRPSDLVNRAEMAKFAFAVSGLKLEKATAAPFKDVAMGQWYTDYVYTLSKNGIVSGDKLNGVATGTFRPTANLNRAEATKMLVNAAQLSENLKGAPHFPDVKSSDWYYNFVETAFNSGVVAGYADGTFGPAKNINRAEVAKMVYLSIHGVSKGFVVESAAAASKTQVELIFSANVDKATAETVANYTVEDSTGAKLAVSKAEYVSADTVHLTTATQNAGTTYYVTTVNVKSAAGDKLSNTDKVSFLGYGADVSGGALSVALSTQTPVAGSVPSGATGVVFTCFDMKAGSSAAVLKSLRVHRVGPGSEAAFENVYLYKGDTRLTTGRSINTETQMVEFNNVNQTIAAGENAKFCVVADLTTSSNGGVHAFELVSAADVLTNSADFTGSFPLRGADQLITNASVGTTTVKKNGSLDDVTVGATGARIAQFEIAAGSSEDQQLKRMALYVRGSAQSSALKNFKLYNEGNTTVLATADSVGAKDLVTFSLATPFKIARGQSKIFYVTADITSARNSEDIKVYVDEPNDVFVTGVTYGYGTRVDINGADTAGTTDGIGTDGFDGTENAGGSSAEYSYVSVKGSKFNIGFNGPVAGDIAINQKKSRCMDLTITNAAGLDVQIKDWVVQLDGTLLTGTTPNYTLIKLAELNEDGSVGGTLLGSNELVTTGSASSQQVTLKGNATIASGTSKKVTVALDVANESALSGSSIRCTLLAPVGGDKVKDSNNDALAASDITPSSNIAGNTMSVVASSLTLAKSSSPSDNTKYAKGATNATLLAIQAKAGSSLDQSIKSLVVHGDNPTTAYTTATATSNAAGTIATLVLPGTGYYTTPAVTVTGGTCTTRPTAVAAINATTGVLTGITLTGAVACTVAPTLTVAAPTALTTDIKDLIDSVGIYDSTGKLVSDLKSFPASAVGSNAADMTFNNLNIAVAKNSTVNLFVKGNVSNSLSTQVNVAFYLPSTPLVIDQNGLTTTGVDVSTINGDGAPATDKLLVTLGTSPIVASTVTASNDPKIFTEGLSAPIFAFTLKSTNGSSNLQEMVVKVKTTGSQLPIDQMALYGASSSGTCDTSKLLKDYETVSATSATTGYVKFTSINQALSDSQNVYFCVSLKAKSVTSGQPASNSSLSLNNTADALVPNDPGNFSIGFTKVQDQSGTNIVVPPLAPALTDSVFFMGVPTFALQNLQTTVLSNDNLEVLKFKAGSIGNVNQLKQLVVSYTGNRAPNACSIEKAGGSPVAATSVAGGQIVFSPGLNLSWENGVNYTVKCSFVNIVPGSNSFTAKLAPTAAPQSAIIWDDGNTTSLLDADFSIVDNIVFLNQDLFKSQTLSVSF